MAGGNQDHLVGPILCFTLRDQSYISKVPDPQKVFNRTEWISVLAEPNPIRFGKSSKMNSSLQVSPSLQVPAQHLLPLTLHRQPLHCTLGKSLYNFAGNERRQELFMTQALESD